MNALLGSLNEAELSLVRETGRDQLAGLDEDALVDLHTRVRRARDRHVKIYRRQAAPRVNEIGGRGKAYPKNTRNRGKAEIFEDALARVSRRLATAARASASALKAERLDEARRGRNTAPPSTAHPKRPARSARPTGPARGPQVAGRTPDRPELRQEHAASQAKGARRQARRDSR